MIPVFITARIGSTRLPGKHFLKLGNLTVIEHIVRRCEHFGLEPFICCPAKDVPQFTSCCTELFGGHDDVDKRLIEAAKHYEITHFHHLDGDDPFFSGSAIRTSFNTTRAVQHASANSRAGQALLGTTYNMGGEGIGEVFELFQSPWPQRLTLDYEEDYHLLAAVNRMVGGYMAPRSAVDELFVKNPDLHKINWFRTEEWNSRQRREITNQQSTPGPK